MASAGTMTITTMPHAVCIDVHIRLGRWCRLRLAVGIALMKLGAFIGRAYRLIVTKTPPDGPLGERFDETMHRLAAEITRAYGKFPDNRFLIDALAEEIGEAAREDLRGLRGNSEWLQVACVAMRLYMHGTPDADTPVLPLFVQAEQIARQRLEREGHS